MSMKDINKLARADHFLLTREDAETLTNALNEHQWKKRSAGETSMVQGSFSAEVRIAVDYRKLGFPKEFGEWLHLRFYDKYDRDTKEYKHTMRFIFNMYESRKKLSYNKAYKEQMLEGMNLLLDFVAEATGQERSV